MKTKIMATLIPFLFCIATPALAESECVAFSNYHTSAVNVEPIPSPGEGLDIQPKATVILNGDRQGLCEQNNCRYALASENPHSFIIIDGIPRGSHIIYGGGVLYYVDKNAHVKC